MRMARLASSILWNINIALLNRRSSGTSQGTVLWAIFGDVTANHRNAAANHPPSQSGNKSYSSNAHSNVVAGDLLREQWFFVVISLITTQTNIPLMQRKINNKWMKKANKHSMKSVEIDELTKCTVHRDWWIAMCCVRNRWAGRV